MKKDYMTRLERAARWRLPRREADDVIADYRDIVGNPPRSEEELRREVGDPEKVIQMLVSPPRAYRVWLGIFAALTVLLLAAALGYSPLTPFWRVSLWYEWGGGWLPGDPEYSIMSALPVLHLAVGAALCLVWFRRWGEKGNGSLSKGLPICALLMLAGILLAWWAVWRCCSSPEQFLTIWTEDTSFIGEGDGPAYSGRSSQTMATVGAWLFRAGLVTALIGMAALVKARTRDRRWAAVYLLALTAAVLTLAVLAMLENFSSLNPLCDVVPANWFQPYLPRFAVITAAGLVGAGAALW